ncbi:unnamed protein product, partial [Adineta steineri]
MNNAFYMAQAQQMLGNNIMNPQQQQKWMEKPLGDPSGLAYLKPLDALLAKQVVSLTEMMIGLPTQAKFGIFNDKGEQVYYAFEESDICQRLYCPKTRKFDLHIVDSTNQEIIRIKREFKCCSGCCWCACCEGCSQEVTVESPPGTVIGFVSQECSCWRMHYILKDASQTPILKIVGPGCICDGPYTCCCENKFTLYGTDGITEIGAIHKKYRGFIAEAMTSADNFAIRIPMDMDVKMKAVALGALFLIDFVLSKLNGNKQVKENITIHVDIICNGCQGSVIRNRYKCMECWNYDLCQTCLDKNLHREHSMLKLIRAFSHRRCERRACFIRLHYQPVDLYIPSNKTNFSNQFQRKELCKLIEAQVPTYIRTEKFNDILNQLKTDKFINEKNLLEQFQTLTTSDGQKKTNECIERMISMGFIDSNGTLTDLAKSK